MPKHPHLPALTALALALGCAAGLTSTASTAGTTATYYQSGGSASYAWQAITASGSGQSAVCVANGGAFTLSNSTVSNSGDTTSSSASLASGLNAAVLVKTASVVGLVNCSVTTSGTGATGVFATDAGTSVTMSGGSIQCSDQWAHGAAAASGAALALSGVTVATSGADAAAVACGSGTLQLTSVTVTATGVDSPALSTAGTATVTGGTYAAGGAEAAVVEAGGSLVATGAYFSTTASGKRGVLMYQSGTGTSAGTFTMSGGSLTATAGPLFLVTNVTGAISLTGVSATTASGVLLEAGGTSSWGTSGSNGGLATLTASAQTLSGNLVTDDAFSSITATLRNSSSLTGTINRAALTLDASSTWTVTGTSYLTTLSDAAGLSGSTITNIVGNGHNVYYNAALAANSYLASGTYALAGGGELLPQ